MKKRKNKSLVLLLVILIFALGIASCSLPTQEGIPESEQTLIAREIYLALTETSLAMALQELPESTQTPVEDPQPQESETPAPTSTPIVHNILPGEPGWVISWMNDTRSSNFASENRAPGGDILNINLLERPFTQTEMVYRPDIDIEYAELYVDDNFFYIKIFLAGSHPDTTDLSRAAYGVELDIDLDGRGDYLVWANGPCGESWSINGMVIFSDPNNDVGGNRPILADAPVNGDGYNQIIFSMDQLQDPDAAWCRQAGSDEMLIAFKRSIINNPVQFLWGVWADDGVRDPALFDYNDTFTSEQAGSPIKGDVRYPVKELYLVDNTCREAFGFDPTGSEYGICPRPEPTATNTPEPTITPTQFNIIPIPTSTPTQFFIIPIPTSTPTQFSIIN